MGVEEIREKLRQVKAAIQRMNEEKKQAEKKRKNGENCLENFFALKRKLEEGLSEFEGKLSERTGDIPGEFGTYYRDSIQEQIAGGKIRDLLPEVEGAVADLKTKILDLDDKIADLVSEISEKTSLFKQLKAKLEAMGEAVEEFIDWIT